MGNVRVHYGCSYTNFEIFFIIYLLFYRYKSYLSKFPRQVYSDNCRTGLWINVMNYVHSVTQHFRNTFSLTDATGSCSHGLRPDLT